MSERHLRAVDSGDEPRISRHEPDSGVEASLEDQLEAAGRGSAQAFEAVYAATAAQVYRVALRVIRDQDLAQDVAQEALVTAWRKAPDYDRSRGSAKAWVLTIAHRRAVDRVRREQRQRDEMEAQAAVAEREAGAPDQDAVVEVEYRKWQSKRVRSAMEALTPLQREAIELAYYEGRTHTQVSEKLGIPLGTAKTRIRDGLTRMRGALEGV